jgi:hypothetical protein
MAMGVLSVQQDRKKAEACSGRVFLLYELFRHEDDSAAAGNHAVGTRHHISFKWTAACWLHAVRSSLGR